MGAVYASRIIGSKGIGRIVAVKVMLNRQPDNSDVQAFLAEAQVTALLDHPNVVRTIELGEEEGSLFIAMELIRGQSLRKILVTLGQQKQHLPLAIVARVIGQAANGLHAAHELHDGAGRALNLIHRDLSPDNVLLSYAGRVYVSDFGVAKLSNTASTHTGVVKGKFAYMSPEQVSAEPLDRRSDIFALGILLWEALTGRRLFKGGTPRETVAAILRDSIRHPKKLRPDVPDGLANVALRCLRQSPQARYATAKEVADELRAFVKDSGQLADESDLAEMLESLFSRERAELEAKLDESITAAKSRAATMSPQGKKDLIARQPKLNAEGTVGSLASAVSDTQPRPMLGRVAFVLALVAVSGVFVTLFFAQGKRPPKLRSALGAYTTAVPSASTSASASTPEKRDTLSPALSASAFAPNIDTTTRRTAPRRPAPRTTQSPRKPKDDLFEDL